MVCGVAVAICQTHPHTRHLGASWDPQRMDAHMVKLAWTNFWRMCGLRPCRFGQRWMCRWPRHCGLWWEPSHELLGVLEAGGTGILQPLEPEIMTTFMVNYVHQLGRHCTCRGFNPTTSVALQAAAMYSLWKMWGRACRPRDQM